MNQDSSWSCGSWWSGGSAGLVEFASIDGSGWSGMPSLANSRYFLDDPNEFDDPQVFKDPKGISIGSMDYDNPKVYVYTSESRSVLDILRLFDKNFNLHLR